MYARHELPVIAIYAQRSSFSEQLRLLYIYLEDIIPFLFTIISFYANCIYFKIEILWFHHEPILLQLWFLFKSTFKGPTTNSIKYFNIIIIISKFQFLFFYFYYHFCIYHLSSVVYIDNFYLFIYLLFELIQQDKYPALNVNVESQKCL